MRSLSPSGPRTVAESSELIERCNALLKNRAARCSRPAFGVTGLCLQHRAFGCEAPWGGWDRDGMPVGHLRRVVGARNGGFGCA